MLEEPTTLPIMATAVPRGRREKAPEEGGIKKRKHGYYGYHSSSSVLLRETELWPRPFLCPHPHTEDKPSGQPRQPEQRTKGSFPKLKTKIRTPLFWLSENRRQRLMGASLASTTQPLGHWRKRLHTPDTEPRQELPTMTRGRGPARHGPAPARRHPKGRLSSRKPAGEGTTPRAAADSASGRRGHSN